MQFDMYLPHFKKLIPDEYTEDDHIKCKAGGKRSEQRAGADGSVLRKHRSETLRRHEEHGKANWIFRI